MALREGTRSAFDWEAARAKMRQRLENLHADRPRQQVDEILQRRAQILAQEVEKDFFREGDIQILSFLSNGERYGVAAECVRSVSPLEECTPVPCTPSFVMGVFNVRGQVYSLVDMRDFLGLNMEENHTYRNAMLTEAAGIEFALAVDEVFDVVGVRPEDLGPAKDSRFAIEDRYIRGLTRDLVIVLDLPSIARDPRFIVCEEVGPSGLAT